MPYHAVDTPVSFSVGSWGAEGVALHALDLMPDTKEVSALVRRQKIVNNPALVERILIGSVVAMTGALIYVVSGTLNAPIVNAGDKAPDFAVLTDHGHTITPSNFRGKLLVLNFWASWCAPCNEEEPSLQAFQRAYAPRGVVVLGVSTDRIDRNYHRFLERFQVGFDTWRDPEAEAGLAARYGTVQIPETYVIDSSGRVVIKVPDPQDFTSPDFLAGIEKHL